MCEIKNLNLASHVINSSRKRERKRARARYEFFIVYVHGHVHVHGKNPQNFVCYLWNDLLDLSNSDIFIKE